MVKKGMLRIAEASIAVILVLGAILTVSINRQTASTINLEDLIPPILEKISKNNTLREKIFLDETSAINEINLLVEKELNNPSIGYEVSICQDINAFCGGLNEYPTNADGNIYSSERVISTRLDSESYSPRKIKIYLWRITS